MDEENGMKEDLQSTFPRIYDRLGQIPGYSWDRSVEPFHSTYDDWHVFGVRHVSSNRGGSLKPPSVERRKANGAVAGPQRPVPSRSRATVHDASANRSTSRELASTQDLEPVVARISRHALRLERQYYLCKSLLETADPDCKHVVQPLDFVRLPSRPGDQGSVAIFIFKSPGRNHLRDSVNFGPAFYGSHSPQRDLNDVLRSPGEQISLLSFLDFATGASECLELLHHGQRTVHGEIRGDAFHFNREKNEVKLINFGSGLRSFEHGLTSAGWSNLSREIGAKNKLQFIAPEQTGRMPSGPDSRSDIYSLGILFWVLLSGDPAFDGETPMETVQNVLSRRLPPVSSKRMDIPEVLSSIIQKMTMKQIDDRYHSASGVKYDLLELQKILANGDGYALKTFQIGTKDVSSYFTLPTMMVGREKEHQQIVGIIERASKRFLTPHLSRHDPLPYGSQSSVSGSRLESAEIVEHSSDGSASGETKAPKGPASGDTVQKSGSVGVGGPHEPPEDVRSSTASTASGWNQPPAAWLGPSDHGSAVYNRSLHDSRGSVHESVPPTRHTSRRHREKTRCEIISIAGAAGLGKSCLVQSVQTVARRYGYLASAKFDTANKQPFAPVLKVMSSLFRQIFSESDVTTELHQLIRAYVAPLSSLLPAMLDVPEHLLEDGAPASQKKNVLPASQVSLSKMMPESLLADTVPVTSEDLQAMQHLIRGSSSGKSLRFASTFLDLLRLLAHHKFICLCFDDLQFADEESLELISNIVAANIGLVVIVTYREREMLAERVRSLLESGTAILTKIQLTPLSEDNFVDYVAATLSRPREYVIPLAAVIQEKTAGNPFLLREVLDTCYRKRCLWYDWKISNWVFDLDKVFQEFEGSAYGESLNNDFIVRRLKELSPSSRTILAWGSLLGNTFSFALVQKLMSGEFDYDDDEARDTPPLSARQDVGPLSDPALDVVAGLQEALQSYVIVSGDDDDQFRFAHDRYMQAAVLLRECQNTTKMHFLIAQTMMKYHGLDDRDLYVRSEHVGKSLEIIQRRVEHRRRFRDLLHQAAQKADGSGARTTALHYYRSAISLLQPEPWEDGDDRDYQETLDLFTSCGECCCFTGHIEDALATLETTFEKARTPVDKAPSWIIQSRIYVQSGDTRAAFRALKQCLASLGLSVEGNVSWEQCDSQFHRLCSQIQSIGPAKLADSSPSSYHRVATMGAVLVEIVSAAFWSDSLVFYQLVLKVIELHLRTGPSAYTGLGYLYLAIIAVSRFNMITFAAELNSISQALLITFQDAYALARARLTYWLMIGHLHSHVRTGLIALESATESSTALGNRVLSLLNIGVISLYKLYASDDLSDVENFCTYAPEEFPDFDSDWRGGTLVVGVRQVARALQGKTKYQWPLSVLSDDDHDSESYIREISAHSSAPDWALDCYYTLAMIPLYLYEHYDVAIAIGEARMATVDQLWSMLATRALRFYLSLALFAVLRRDPLTVNKGAVLAQIRTYKKSIEDWEVIEDVNFLMWSKLLSAELCDAMGDAHGAMEGFEDVLTHCQVHGFVLEEAITNELAAGFYLRRGARRASQAFAGDAIVAYRRLGASGKADQLVRKLNGLLRLNLRSRVEEVGVQTESHGESSSGQYQQLAVEENDRQIKVDEGEQSNHDRTRHWIRPDRTEEKHEVPGLGIDVIDLQSILTSSQVISSELQLDKLLPKMCEIILGGNSANFAAIIIEEEDIGWTVAASGDHENGVQSHNPGFALNGAEVENEVATHVALYALRFREPVFLQNLLSDERFCNVSEKYQAKNPLGKSVIAMPILHGEDSLLGALYLEGLPHTFTGKHRPGRSGKLQLTASDRNLTVLQLLVNQIGISMVNANLFKKVRNVSADNKLMIESQKRALAQARAAEVKAKRAEAEAIRSLRLAEEAAKAKSIFLANVSHELRTPLNGMIGNSELLKATRMTAEQEEYADSIRICADTLLTVINDILDYSKLEAGKMQLVAVPFHLRDAIREVIRALSCTHVERQLQTVEKLSLPDMLVVGDPIRLHQVLMNLLSNSYKFTPSGIVTVTAAVESETADEIAMVCSVADTGIGINAEQLKRLFQPFSQADNSTARRYGGSGLGLSICKNLIEIMNGRIWIDSEYGRGTRVSFALTLAKAPASAAAVEPQITAKNPGPSSSTAAVDGEARPGPGRVALNLSGLVRDQIRILVAEDNPINQKIAISFVQRLGFRVDASDDGRQAVEALRAQAQAGTPYHLVLLDVQMPELDGYAATRAIRQDPAAVVRDVLVIAMTASAIMGDREKCLEAGMNDYLAKPVRAKVLKEMLELYLHQAGPPIPDLHRQAQAIAKHALRTVDRGLAEHAEKKPEPEPEPELVPEPDASKTAMTTTTTTTTTRVPPPAAAVLFSDPLCLPPTPPRSTAPEPDGPPDGPPDGLSA
ncbi:MAG: hypothetical protein M1826_004457 [Phylliscum demangeonii]|nr:MAG: hypothetical protein M1826_004457 [Phylliscum demangeonii]